MLDVVVEQSELLKKIEEIFWSLKERFMGKICMTNEPLDNGNNYCRQMAGMCFIQIDTSREIFHDDSSKKERLEAAELGLKEIQNSLRSAGFKNVGEIERKTTGSGHEVKESLSLEIIVDLRQTSLTKMSKALRLAIMKELVEAVKLMTEPLSKPDQVKALSDLVKAVVGPRATVRVPSGLK